jgi:type 1 glutamine amidotransferase
MLAALFLICSAPVEPWNVFPGGDGVGNGKHVVLVSGDEEYRSEEALTQLGLILSKRHGFKCTVLYAIDPKDGTVSPNTLDNIPGLEQLKSADLMVLFTRFRDLPDEQCKHFEDYLDRGKPVLGIRTATHAFKPSKTRANQKFGWTSKLPGWEGGFGRAVLGETWVAHHGHHGKEGTRGVPAPGQEMHPVLQGIDAGSIFGTTDVYTVKLPADCKPVVLGEVTATLLPDSKKVEGKKNDPMMPIAWTREFASGSGKPSRVFTSTLGASVDLQWEGSRRLLVNGCLWALGLEKQIPAKSNVDIVGDFKPTVFKTMKTEEWKPGKLPAEYAK